MERPHNSIVELAKITLFCDQIENEGASAVLFKALSEPYVAGLEILGYTEEEIIEETAAYAATLLMLQELGIEKIV